MCDFCLGPISSVCGLSGSYFFRVWIVWVLFLLCVGCLGPVSSVCGLSWSHFLCVWIVCVLFLACVDCLGPLSSVCGLCGSYFFCVWRLPVDTVLKYSKWLGCSVFIDSLEVLESS